LTYFCLVSKDLLFPNKAQLFLQGEGQVFSNCLCSLNAEIFNLVKMIGRVLFYKPKLFPPKEHDYILQTSPHPTNKTYEMQRFS